MSTSTEKPQSKPVKMTASQITDMLVKRYLAYIGWDPITKKAGVKPRLVCRPLVIIGPKGVGKSEIPAQAAAKIQAIIGDSINGSVKGVAATVASRGCNLQFLECPDLAGLPYIEKVDGETATMHGRPVLLPKTGFGLWFLDEPNRAGRDIRSALLTLVQDRKVNDYFLGENWMMVMAMNPPEAHGVTYEVGEWDAALQDRVSPVWFEGSVKELVDHLRSKYGNHVVVRWIESGGPDASTNKVVDFQGRGRNSPRGLEFLIRAIEAVGGIDSPEWFRAAEIEIGSDQATVLGTYLRAIRTIIPEEVLDTWSPEVAKKISDFESEGRNDALMTLKDGVATLLAKRFESGAMVLGTPETDTVLTRVCQFLDGAPADLKTSFFLSAQEIFNGTTIADKTIFNKMCAFISKSPDSRNLMKYLKKVHEEQKIGREKAAAEAAKAAEKK